MMYYKKNTKSLPSYQTKRISLGDFSDNMDSDKSDVLLEDGQPRLAYNVKSSFGELSANFGVRELLLCNRQSQSDNYVKKLIYNEGQSFKKIWRYKYYSEHNNRYEFLLLFLDSSNVIYWANMFGYDNTISTFQKFTFNEEPTSISFRVNGRNVIGFASPSDSLVVWYCDEEAYSVDTAPKFKSICLHNERLFALDSDADHLVRFSSKTNPLDWTVDGLTSDAGVIELNDFKGELKLLVSFLDNVIVFREFGISKISSYSASSKFTAANVYDSSCKIYCNTVCVCGQEIFFLAEDGLYKFDGYNVDKVDIGISKLIFGNRQDEANACYFEGRLYLACKMSFEDEEAPSTNNAIIQIDPISNKFNVIRGVDVACMFAIKDLKMTKMVMCLNGENSGKLWELCEASQSEIEFDRFWQSGKITFGNFDKHKTLKEVSLCSKADISLKVKTEKGEKTFKILGKDKIQRVRINLKAKMFEISFEGSGAEFLLKTAQFIFAV